MVAAARAGAELSWADQSRAEYCRLSSISNVYRYHYCDLVSCLCVIPQLIIWRKFRFDNDLSTFSQHINDKTLTGRLCSHVLFQNALIRISHHATSLFPLRLSPLPSSFTANNLKERWSKKKTESVRNQQKAITLKLQRDAMFCYDLPFLIIILFSHFFSLSPSRWSQLNSSWQLQAFLPFVITNVLVSRAWILIIWRRACFPIANVCMVAVNSNRNMEHGGKLA